MSHTLLVVCHLLLQVDRYCWLAALIPHAVVEELQPNRIVAGQPPTLHVWQAGEGEQEAGHGEGTADGRTRATAKQQETRSVAAMVVDK